MFKQSLIYISSQPIVEFSIGTMTILTHKYYFKSNINIITKFSETHTSLEKY